ncbi:MAG: hypothetical protein ACT4PP_00995 [Sporichthyaceae bacterium]
MLAAFDPNDYRKRVLAEILRRGGGDHSDPFELYDLPLADAERLDDAAVSRRLDEVWGFWQRHRDHPKYAGLAADLVADHEARARLLLAAPTRAVTARAVREQRATRDADRFALLDAAIRALIDKHGALPRAKLAHLHQLGISTGLSQAEATGRVAMHRVSDDAPIPAMPSPAEDDRRRQIRALLEEFGALGDHDEPPVTLLALLDLGPDADDAAITLAARAWRARAREIPPQRLRAVVDELLVHVADQLERGPLARERYLDAVARDVAERLRPQVLAAVLVEDRLTSADAEVLTAAARALGLDGARAARVPREIARELGAGFEDAPERAAPASAPQATPRIDYTRRDPRWTAPLREARAALRAGRPGDAQHHVNAALAAAGAEPPPAVTALRDEIAEALSRVGAVPAPGEVRVQRIRGSVHVSWQRAGESDLSYRVQRRKPDGGWHTVGRTGGDQLEDGGAPPDQPLTYAVVAIRAGQLSPPSEGHCS